VAHPQHRLPDRPGGDDPGRGRRLGIDVGSVRIGVATSDPDGILATPVETVRRDRTRRHLRRLTQLVADLDAVDKFTDEMVTKIKSAADPRAGIAAAQTQLDAAKSDIGARSIEMLTIGRDVLHVHAAAHHW